MRDTYDGDRLTPHRVAGFPAPSIPPRLVDRPWIVEDPVDVDEARARIRAHVPDVPARTVEPLGAGWDNSAFLVDGRWVVRFPRRASAVALLETESRVLPLLAPRLPLAVPEPAFVVAATGAEGPFAGYPLIAGRTACVAALSETQRHAAAPTLGRFLRALHDVPVDDLALPGDTLGRLRLDGRRHELEARLGVLEDRAVVDSPGPWIEAFDALGPDAPGGLPGRAVHGDLYARHLVVDAQGRIQGVIDWGDVHRGDPAADLMVAFGFLPATARDGFFRAYGEVDPPTRRAARRRALFHAVAVAWYATESDDRVLATEARRTLAHVLQPGPFPDDPGAA